MDLSDLMRPTSIAIVGASPSRTFGGRSLQHLRRAGFKGTVYPVNPNYQEIHGYTCYPTVSAIPGTVDVAVLAVPNKAVEPVLAELGTKGCKAAVVLSSGFAESGPEGAAMQRSLVATARAAGIRLVGPNCNGVVNFVDSIALGPTTLMEREKLIAGSVAIVSQSGSVGASVVDMVMEAGVGFSYSVAVGNCADLGVEDFIEMFVADPHTRTVLVGLEGVRDAEAFRRALEAARTAGKQVAILKLGRSATGEQVVATHTGALAGSYRTLAAVAKRHGAIMARDMEELLSIAWIRSAYPQFAGGDVAILSSSGGMCSLLADSVDAAGGRLAALTTDSVQKLTAMGYLPPHNPLDFSRIARAESRQDEFLQCLGILCDDPNTAGVIVGLGLSHLITQRAEYCVQMKELSPKPVLVYLPEGSVGAEARAKLQAGGVPTFRSLQTCMSVLQALNTSRTGATGPASPATPAHGHTPAAETAGPAARTLGEVTTKELLRAHGVATPAEVVAHSEAEALTQATAIGYPVVLKLFSQKGLHKSDQGLVRLNIPGPAALSDTYQSLRARAEEQDLWEGAVVVAKMVPTHRGMELLIGIQRDPVFGPVCAVGTGGIWTEVWEDVAIVPLPASQADLQAAVASLRIGSGLMGSKQRHPLDVAALWPAIAGICATFEELGESALSLEVNPLCVLPAGEGCLALDARCQIRN